MKISFLIQVPLFLFLHGIFHLTPSSKSPLASCFFSSQNSLNLSVVMGWTIHDHMSFNMSLFPLVFISEMRRNDYILSCSDVLWCYPLFSAPFIPSIFINSGSTFWHFKYVSKVSIKKCSWSRIFRTSKWDFRDDAGKNWLAHFLRMYPTVKDLILHISFS